MALPPRGPAEPEAGVRIAVVVQRYGMDVYGGAELHARQVAERLAAIMQVEVLTTCARDYMTWDNHYPPGRETINGLPVLRFAVDAPRDVPAFNRLSARVLGGPHSYQDEAEWVARQGPLASGLFDWLRAEHERYDLVLFFTYLYASTAIGLPLVAHKSVLVPTSHDEPPIYLDVYRALFNMPRGFIFNSPEEEHFIRGRFQNHHIPGCVIGVGVDAPPRRPDRPLAEPYLVYLGRVDESKGCGEMFQYFLRYKAATGDPVKLVLVGAQVMEVPRHPDILPQGFLPDDDRFWWLQHAQLLLLPSPYESLSMATLEAWAAGVPVLVNGKTPVLRGHCRRSQGGLYYDNGLEFLTALQLLRADAELRARLGRNGQEYVKVHYEWQTVIRKHVSFIKSVYDLVYPSHSPARPDP